jgi:ferrous iron transport protein B
VLAINILFATGALKWLGEISSPLVVGWLGLPKEASTALLAGFLRKDLAVGMLLPLEEKVGMTAAQLTVAATVLTVYFPCAATFAVLLKELRPKDMLKATAIMVIASLAVGGLLRLALM